MSNTRKCVLLSAGILALRCMAATDAQCSEFLQRALEAKNPETRQQAVIALSLAAVQGPLMKQLVGMLDDKDVQVRLAVVTGLAELKTPAATSLLPFARPRGYARYRLSIVKLRLEIPSRVCAL